MWFVEVRYRSKQGSSQEDHDIHEVKIPVASAVGETIHSLKEEVTDKEYTEYTSGTDMEAMKREADAIGCGRDFETWEDAFWALAAPVCENPYEVSIALRVIHE
jgi:DNA-binding IclR family transcriptional regulator